MLGTGSAGLAATYAIGAVMLVVNYLLGLWWNKHLPSTVKEEGWTTRVVAKIAVLAAVAAAGGEVDVPTIAGKTKIRIPAGTQSDTVLRLKGKGAPSLRGGGRGDLHIRILVETPTGLNKEQLELLEKFNASLTGKNHRRQQEFAERAKNFLKGE